MAPTISPSKDNLAVWKLIGTSVWGAVIALAFVVVQTIATVVVYALRVGRGTEGEQFGEFLKFAMTDGQALSIATYSSALTCIPLILGVIKLKRGSAIYEYLALQPVSIRAMLPWLGILVIYLVGLDATSLLVGRPVVPEFMKSIYTSSEPVWPLWVALLIAGPLFEETFFRGFLYTGLAASTVRPLGAIIVTSVAWAAIHVQYDLYDVASIFVLGLILGGARMHCRSTWAPLALHSLTNLAATVEAAAFVKAHVT